MPHCGGEGQTAPKHQRETQEYCCVQPGHASLSCWFEPAKTICCCCRSTGSKFWCHPESTRQAQKTSSQGRCWVQGSISEEKMSALGGYNHKGCTNSQHTPQLPHKPQYQPEMAAVIQKVIEVIQNQVQFSDTPNIRPPIHSNHLDTLKQGRTHLP